MKAFHYLGLVLTLIVPLNEASGESNEPMHFEDTLQSTHGHVVFSSILFQSGVSKNDIFDPESPFGTGIENAIKENLLAGGRKRVQRLAQWSRARYAELLKGRSYTPGYVKAISSELERTISDAQFFLNGFYADNEEDLGEYTINVSPNPEPNDENDCQHEKAENAVGSSETVHGYYTNISEQENLLRYLEQRTQNQLPRDDPIQTYGRLRRLYDRLQIQENLGLPLPDWSRDVYPVSLRKLLSMYLQTAAYHEKKNNSLPGHFTASVIRAMMKKRNGDSEFQDRSFKLYSGFDVTLASVMDGWEVWNYKDLPRSAALFIELRLKEKDYVVTLLYVTADDNPPILLELPTRICKNPCTLDNFIKGTSALIPGDWDAECHEFNPEYGSVLF